MSALSQESYAQCMIEELLAYANQFVPAEIMKFTLTYSGPLPAAGRSNKAAEKWAIRKALHPQLVELHQTHPVLKGQTNTASGIAVDNSIAGGQASPSGRTSRVSKWR